MNIGFFVVAVIFVFDLLSQSGCCSASSTDASFPVAGKSSLRATFLGCTTILLDDGETAILTDGFFSRPCEIQSIRRPIEPNTKVIDELLVKVGIKRLAAVLVAHSHHDHALDSAYVAKKFQAQLIGSESTRNIAKGQGFPCELFRVPQDGETFVFNKFKIKIIETPHSPGPLFPGNIEKPLHSPAWIGEYRSGINYNFLIDHEGEKIAIIPSAGVISNKLAKEKADVVFLGIGTLGIRSDAFIATYWQDTVRALGAKWVIPIHWDNFFRPLDDSLEPMPWPVDNVRHTRKELTTYADRDHVKLQWPDSFETFDLPASRP